MLNREVIRDFRDLVNNNSYYILHRYVNQNGKNRWNIICSAMDWITVAVDNINEIEFEKIQSKETYSQVHMLISMIDVMYEAIVQLHRVLLGVKDSPFKGITDIFGGSDFSDDIKHFKHIRAAFSAHPVNLNPSQNRNDRWYASWPYSDLTSGYDLQVYLYPLDSDTKMKILGIKIDELSRFAETIYLHLEKLSQHIDEDFAEYVDGCKNDKIPFSGETLYDLSLARKELEIRLPNEYIESMINDAILFLSVEQSVKENKKIVKEFRKKVLESVEDIKGAVQNLDYSDRESYRVFELKPPNEILYSISKYFAVFEGRYEPLEHYHLGKIIEELKPFVHINDKMSYEEIKLLVYSGLYVM